MASQLAYLAVLVVPLRWVLRSRYRAATAVAAGIACSATGAVLSDSVSRLPDARWSASEREVLRSLSLSSRPALPRDPSNRFADSPRAASLGGALFFDARLSANGQVSCATCHMPDAGFQDGTPLARGVGITTRRTMPIAATAWGRWFFWDGRADSQWAQALGPLESAVEHGGDRLQYARVIAAHYRAEYEAVFGPLPSLRGLPQRAGPVADSARRRAWLRIPPVQRDSITRVYANIGKALAAFERRVDVTPSRFDRYADAVSGIRPMTGDALLTTQEERGLRLFIGKADCVNCHNGPLFTDDHFHNTGVAVATSVVAMDSGRSVGVRDALRAEFACTSPYSDAGPDDCDELRFATAAGEELVRAYKTPSLRGVAERAPYMHAGQLATLTEVLAHYNQAPSAPIGHSELRPLRLSRAEREAIAAFLRTLSSPIAAPSPGRRPQ